MRTTRPRSSVLTLLYLSLLLLSSSAFKSDELLAEDEEFGLEGGHRSPDLDLTASTRSVPPPQPTRPARRGSSDSDSDSKIQFPLEHAFGDSEFSPAGTFTARLKTWSNHQTLTKLRFSREAFTETEKENFKMLLKGDDFYKIRVPSNVLSPPGRDYIISSVKARCLPQDRLDEHFVIHMEGVNILAVNYGSPGACPYPRQLKLPAKWSFNSYTVLKNSEQAPRTPAFAEEILGGENGEGEAVMPPERSFWAKYWMYLIPLGLVVMNAVTQAMNMPEEQAPGQPGAQPQQTTAAALPRGQSATVRRRG
ncbi:hypothetical protein RHGRI_014781 [Rhododendron griersonianum]|uniref:ER membrane protein complex subunit 10 n=1 Tax=Rhododendron griersonianum TaxID=479676 RepID=A0AAV6KB99_9ERIC|nr:hypothetical protein RHGRI_014781 [Rhododendron griersonianum]